MSALLSLVPALVGKLLDWLPSIASYFIGRSAGASAVTAKAAAEAARIKDAEISAAAAAPRTVQSVSDDLKRGVF